MNYVQGYAQGCQERNIKASSLPNTPSDTNGDYNISIPRRIQTSYLSNNWNDANLPNQVPQL